MTYEFDFGSSLLSPQAENEEAVSDAKMQYKNAILRAGKVSLHERLINVFENNRVFEDIIEQEPLKVNLMLLLGQILHAALDTVYYCFDVLICRIVLLV
jgi:hypothetical protein